MTGTAGAAIWSVPLFVAALAGAVGSGDFKLAAPLGALTGALGTLVALAGLQCALILAAIVGLATARSARPGKVEARLGMPLLVGAIAALATMRIFI